MQNNTLRDRKRLPEQSRLKGLSAAIRTASPWRDGLVVFLATMGSNAFAFLLHFFASRWLGVRAYGAFSSMLALLVVISVVATIASTFIARVSAAYYATNDLGAIRSFRRQLMRRVAVGSVIFALALAAVCVPISRFLGVPQSDIVITAVALGLAVSVPPLRGLLQGMHRFASLAVSLALEAIGRFAAALVLVAHSLGAGGAIAGLAVGTLISLVYTIYAISQFGPGEADDVHDLQGSKEATVTISIVIFSVTALSSYDVILVRHFFPAEVAGLYSALALVGRTVFLLISFLPTILLPKTAAFQSARRDSRGLLFRALGVASVLSAVTLIATLLAPAAIVRTLAGGAYASAAPYVLSYACATIFLAVANLVSMYQIGLGHRDFGWLLAIAGLLEASAVCARHESLWTVVLIVLLGHFLVLLSSFFRIFSVGGDDRIGLVKG